MYESAQKGILLLLFLPARVMMQSDLVPDDVPKWWEGYWKDIGEQPKDNLVSRDFS